MHLSPASMLSHFTQHVALYPFPTCVLGQKKGYSSLMNWHTVPLKLRYKANRVLTIQTLHVFRAPLMPGILSCSIIPIHASQSFGVSGPMLVSGRFWRKKHTCFPSRRTRQTLAAVLPPISAPAVALRVKFKAK